MSAGVPLDPVNRSMLAPAREDLNEVFGQVGFPMTTGSLDEIMAIVEGGDEIFGVGSGGAIVIFDDGDALVMGVLIGKIHAKIFVIPIDARGAIVKQRPSGWERLRRAGRRSRRIGIRTIRLIFAGRASRTGFNARARFKGQVPFVQRENAAKTRHLDRSHPAHEPVEDVEIVGPFMDKKTARVFFQAVPARHIGAAAIIMFDGLQGKNLAEHAPSHQVLELTKNRIVAQIETHIEEPARPSGGFDHAKAPVGGDGERFVHQNVFPISKSGQNMFFVEIIRGGHHHGVKVLAMKEGVHFRVDVRLDAQVFIVLPQIETKVGLAHAEAIAAHPITTAIAVGPYDLSADLGVCWNPDHPKHQQAIATIRTAARKAGKNMLNFGRGPDLVKQGFTFLCIGEPTVFMQQALAAANRETKPAVLAKRRQRTGRLQRAFTLVELLVVIAILSIMVALLSPALKAAREMSKSITCVSRLKNLGAGMFIYAGENEGWFPQNRLTGAASTGFCWDVQISKYVGVTSGTGSGAYLTYKGPPVYHCPAGTPINWYVARNNYDGVQGQLAVIPNPSRLCLLLDFWIPLTYQENSYGGGVANNEENSRAPGTFGYRHKGGLNICFADGHVAWVPPSESSGYPKDVIWGWNNGVPVAD